MLEYQIGKVMDMDLVETVPEVVGSIDRATEDGFQGSVPPGHKYMTDDETLYRLPSGVFVTVVWGLAQVPEAEAEAQMAEIRADQ